MFRRHMAIYCDGEIMHDCTTMFTRKPLIKIVSVKRFNPRKLWHYVVSNMRTVTVKIGEGKTKVTDIHIHIYDPLQLVYTVTV